ncbi:MAG: hypothetical protein IPM82_07425 [Saprospiraceae bacterium]|nr:hypothetical protein [Saprospiraceae bacterium]
MMGMTLNIRKRELDTADFQAIRSSDEYFDIRLGDYVADTVIAGVFLHRACVEAILDWSSESLTGKLPSQVDEVGGYLLGKYVVVENGDYEIAIHHFCPAKGGCSKPGLSEIRERGEYLARQDDGRIPR